MTPQDILRYLSVRQLPLTSEKRAQDLLELEFRASGIAYEREFRLSDRDIIDFLIGPVGLEMKVKGRRRLIFEQIERYCEHDALESLVLATNVSMRLPSRILGKPVYVAQLGLAWL